MRVFTQNIDTLEQIAQIPQDLVVYCHGSFASAHCINCRQEHTPAFVYEMLQSDQVPKCSQCGGLVKPDIVFFGEPLPEKFFVHVLFNVFNY